MRSLVAVAPAVVAASLAVAGCGGAGSARPTPTGSSTGSTGAPSATPVACPPTSGGGAGRARVTDMTIGTASGQDSLVVQFDAAVPHYELTQNPNGVHFTGGGGKGGTYTLAGSYGFLLNIDNLNWTTPPGDQYPHGTDLMQSAPVLEEARQIGDFEGTDNIAIGLRSYVCPTIFTLDGPRRLVLQFLAGS